RGSCPQGLGSATCIASDWCEKAAPAQQLRASRPRSLVAAVWLRTAIATLAGGDGAARITTAGFETRQAVRFVGRRAVIAMRRFEVGAAVTTSSGSAPPQRRRTPTVPTE